MAKEPKYAKRILGHYITMLMGHVGLRPNFENRNEIEGAVDDIYACAVAQAKDEIMAELTQVMGGDTRKEILDELAVDYENIAVTLKEWEIEALAERRTKHSAAAKDYFDGKAEAFSEAWSLLLFGSRTDFDHQEFNEMDEKHTKLAKEMRDE